ncbi:MAG: hypothetical protein WAM95_09210 [Bacillus sp. (in: firmicutes)]
MTGNALSRKISKHQNRLALVEVAKTKQSKQVQRVQRTSLHHHRRLSKSLVLLTVGATGLAC